MKPATRSTLLNAYPLLRSRDVEDAGQRMGKIFSPHRLALQGSGRRFDVRHNQVRLRDISINVLRYGADVSIDSAARADFYMVQLPLAGQAQISCANEHIVADSATMSILQPHARSRMDWNGDCTMILVQVPCDAIRRSATGMGNRLNPGLAQFRSRNDQRVAAWWQAVEDLVRNLDRFGDHWLRNPAAYVALEEFLVCSLVALLCDPDTSAQDMDSDSRCFALATDYVRAHLDRALTADDIARHARVHPRTVEAIFKRMGEVSPVAYARRCRLQAVRNTLQAAQRSQRDLSVTQVALDHGFSHMGRFAAQYRAAFGLSPSDERADMTRDSTRA